MQQLGSLLAFPVHLIESRGSFSPDDPRVQSECPQCGSLPPRPVTVHANGHPETVLGVGYLPRLCPCQIEARQQELNHAGMARQQAEERAKRVALAQSCYPYTWFNRGFAPTHLLTLTFANFCTTTMSARLAYEQVQDFGLWAEEPQGNIIVWGPPGVGKTHLMAALCNARRTHGFLSLFVNIVALFRELRMRWDEHLSTSDLERAMLSAPLLILDDLGRARLSDTWRELVYSVINWRMESGKSTAFTTNDIHTGNLFELVQPQGLDEAMVSRLQVGLRLLHLDDEDHRVTQVYSSGQQAQ